MWAGVAQSVQLHVTSSTVRESNPDGVQILHTHLDEPCIPPSLPYRGYLVTFQGVKRLGPNIDHQPPSNAKVKERVIPLLPLRVHMAGYRVTFTPIFSDNHIL